MKKLLFLLMILLSSCSWTTGPDIALPPVDTTSYAPIIIDTINVVWNCYRQDSIIVEYEEGEWIDNQLMIPMSSCFTVKNEIPNYHINWVYFDHETSCVLMTLAKMPAYCHYWVADTIYLKEFTVVLISNYE